MNWNYRLIDLSHENGNEPWVELHEVFYEDDGSLMGYTPVSAGSEDVATLRQTLEWMLLALDKPALTTSERPHETQTHLAGDSLRHLLRRHPVHGLTCMEAGMKWDGTYKGGNECYIWHDLLTGEGTDKDKLLGYVRHNLTNGEFIACINDMRTDTKKFDNLEDAKAHIITYYVTQKLEGT